MGRLVLLCIFTGLLTTAFGQDQEHALVNRLLRPDMTLGNSVQNKKFLADGAPVTRKAAVSTFYIQRKPKANVFADTRNFSTERFDSHSFDPHQNIPPQKQIKPSSATYNNRSFAEQRYAPDASKTRDTRSFAGQRPFLDRGKSEKSLQRQNPPMTIEQVRELLNKNK